MNASKSYFAIAASALLGIAGCAPSHRGADTLASSAAAKSAPTPAKVAQPQADGTRGDRPPPPPPPVRPAPAPMPPPPTLVKPLATPPHRVFIHAAPASDKLTTDAAARYAPPPVAAPVREVTPEATASRERYRHYRDNPLRAVARAPVSTFGLDVDTGSWSNVRRILDAGSLPPAAAVRAEEFINYFDYHYPTPRDRETPFSITTEVAPAPWNPAHELMLIGVQGYRVDSAAMPAANLVFLIDTSGSMAGPRRLGLLKAALKPLVASLRERDHVAIVTYAGSAGVALASTRGDRHARILAAIDGLHASGSTNGEAGLALAYREARRGFIAGGINRVILATDGDFNVGQTSVAALKTEVAERRASDGVALSTLGVGSGNYNDRMAVALADAGDGNYHYLGNLQDARKALVDERGATLLTIARDAKIEVEFNPARISHYRLIGYVKRHLTRADFNNDAVDSGDVGAGANVTALYELTPAATAAPRLDPLRYGERPRAAGHADELAFVRLRYKRPGETTSRLIEQAVRVDAQHAHASARLRFAAAVAAFADYLRGGQHLHGFTLADIARLARSARAADQDGHRAEFIQTVALAATLAPRRGHDAKVPRAPFVGLR